MTRLGRKETVRVLAAGILVNLGLYATEAEAQVKPWLAPQCGNRVVEAGEQCDRDDFAGATCGTVGLRDDVAADKLTGL